MLLYISLWLFLSHFSCIFVVFFCCSIAAFSGHDRQIFFHPDRLFITFQGKCRVNETTKKKSVSREEQPKFCADFYLSFSEEQSEKKTETRRRENHEVLVRFKQFRWCACVLNSTSKAKCRWEEQKRNNKKKCERQTEIWFVRNKYFFHFSSIILSRFYRTMTINIATFYLFIFCTFFPLAEGIFRCVKCVSAFLNKRRADADAAAGLSGDKAICHSFVSTQWLFSNQNVEKLNRVWWK